MADSIKALEQFFNDVIAQVIPGALVVLVVSSIVDYQIPQDSTAIFIFFGISYSVGHIVLALDEILRSSVKDIRNFFKNESPNSDVIESDIVSAKELFIKLINKKNTNIDVTYLPLNELRSLAMSVSKEGADLGRRFMFLSLSCKSTVILLLIFVPFLTALELLKVLTIYKVELNFLCTVLLQITILIFLTICVIYPVEKRSMGFKRRAEEVPFSAAMAHLILKKENCDEV
jgi:hypothetical protein